jgi:hypothetical protein
MLRSIDRKRREQHEEARRQAGTKPSPPPNANTEKPAFDIAALQKQTLDVQFRRQMKVLVFKKIIKCTAGAADMSVLDQIYQWLIKDVS